jgi:hypothetical protein
MQGMASSWERKGREGEGVRLGEREGCRRGAMGARPCCSFGSVKAVVREEGNRKEEEEKREKRKEEGNEKKEKRKKFQT